MFNVLGRYPEGAFHPYMGFGVGYANVKINDITWTSPQLSGSETFSSGSKMVLAYQFLLGIDIDVTKNVIVGLGYKLMTAEKVTYDTGWANTRGGSGTCTVEADWTSHNAVLSVSYLF